MLLAPLFSQLPECGSSIGYADNILTMAKTEHDAVAMVKALWSALEAHCAGHLIPNAPKIFNPGQAIEFLGHSIRRISGGVHIEPAQKHRTKFEATIAQSLNEIKKAAADPVPVVPLREKLKRYVNSWTSAFKLCTDISGYQATALAKIDAAIEK